MAVLLASLGLAAQQAPPSDLPELQGPGQPYHTPRAGEGFQTTVFGHHVVVPPRDRSSVTALDLGMILDVPAVDGDSVEPFGALYLWRHPEDHDSFLYASLVGLYNDVYYSKALDSGSGLGLALGFENLTLPVPSTELVDGRGVEAEELWWGYLRGGIGLEYRQQVAPNHNDNMLGVSLLIEPSWFYFQRSNETRDDFVVPDNTFEGRLHLRLRYDAFERNVLELPHEGFAFGADLVEGLRSDWDDWGPNGTMLGAEHRDYRFATGYVIAGGGVPFVDSERHRLLASVHGGIGDDLDRFSAPRVGGGPQGEDYASLFRPVIPGAAIEEFLPDAYVVGALEYRYEPVFFTYVGVRGTVGFVDRQRGHVGDVYRSDDVLAAVTLRLTTGFVFDTRIQMEYTYDTGIVRDDQYGGHQFLIHVSREF